MNYYIYVCTQSIHRENMEFSEGTIFKGVNKGKDLVEVEYRNDCFMLPNDALIMITSEQYNAIQRLIDLDIDPSFLINSIRNSYSACKENTPLCYRVMPEIKQLINLFFSENHMHIQSFIGEADSLAIAAIICEQRKEFEDFFWLSLEEVEHKIKTDNINEILAGIDEMTTNYLDNLNSLIA